MTTTPKARRIWGARVRYALIVTVAGVLGYAPAVLFLHRPIWLFAVAGMSAAVAIVYLVNRAKGRLARAISWRETVVLLAANLYESATLGFVALLMYGCLWALGRAAVYFHSGLSGARYLALWVPVFIGGVGALGTALNASVSLLDLFIPETGIGSRPLGANFTGARIRNFLCWCVPSSVLLAWLGAYRSDLWWVALELLFAAATVQFFPILEPEKLTEAASLAHSAVRNVFEAAGFGIIDRLTTGNVAFDRLMATFDFVAHRDGYGTAIVIKSGPPGTPVKWHDVALVPSAVRLIYDAAETSGIELARVSAMIVLYDCYPDDGLRATAPRESIRLLELQDHELVQTLAQKKLPKEQLTELACSLLGLRRSNLASSNIGAA